MAQNIVRDHSDFGESEVPREMEVNSERLDAWMTRLEAKLDKVGNDVAALMAMRDRLDDHHERLFGNGQPGIVKDVDRLKQWQKSLYWLGGLMASASAAVMFKWFLGR